jgi:hypothetical protein
MGLKTSSDGIIEVCWFVMKFFNKKEIIWRQDSSSSLSLTLFWNIDWPTLGLISVWFLVSSLNE